MPIITITTSLESVSSTRCESFFPAFNGISNLSLIHIYMCIRDRPYLIQSFLHYYTHVWVFGFMNCRLDVYKRQHYISPDDKQAIMFLNAEAMFSMMDTLMTGTRILIWMVGLGTVSYTHLTS